MRQSSLDEGLGRAARMLLVSVLLRSLLTRVGALILGGVLSAVLVLGCGGSSTRPTPKGASSATIARRVEKEVEVSDARCQRLSGDSFRCNVAVGKYGRFQLAVTAPGSGKRPVITGCELPGRKRPNEFSFCAVHDRKG